MTISPLLIAQKIDEVMNRIDDLTDEIANTARVAADAEVEFKIEFAKERLKARYKANGEGRKITTDEVEDHATCATQSKRYAFLLAQNSLTVLREALRAEQAKLDGLRTQSASVRLAGG